MIIIQEVTKAASKKKSVRKITANGEFNDIFEGIACEETAHVPSISTYMNILSIQDVSSNPTTQTMFSELNEIRDMLLNGEYDYERLRQISNTLSKYSNHPDPIINEVQKEVELRISVEIAKSKR